MAGRVPLRGRHGVLAFCPRHQNILLRTLIYELDPGTASAYLPGLPAYILFMCLRYTDYLDDEKAVRSFLNGALQKIFYHVKKNSCNIEIVILWLANVCRLLHTIKQYGGEQKFQTQNTPEQTAQSLLHFDLADYVQLIGDVAIRIIRTATRSMQYCIQHLIEDALLTPATSLLPLPNNKNQRRRSSVFVRELKGPLERPQKLDLLLHRLSTYNDWLKRHAVDSELTNQIWQQIFWFISAEALRVLLERSDLCSWTIGARIRCNVHELEEWIWKNHDGNALTLDSLLPIIQVSHLLQTRKMLCDASAICAMVDCLTIAQVETVLCNYSPEGPLEQKPSTALVTRVRERLMDKREATENEFSLHLYSEQELPLILPFNPSSIRLNDITIPDAFRLYMVYFL